MLKGVENLDTCGAEAISRIERTAPEAVPRLRVARFLSHRAPILPGLGRPGGGAGKSHQSCRSPRSTLPARKEVQLRGSDGKRTTDTRQQQAGKMGNSAGLRVAKRLPVADAARPAARTAYAGGAEALAASVGPARAGPTVGLTRGLDAGPAERAVLAVSGAGSVAAGARAGADVRPRRACPSSP